MVIQLLGSRRLFSNCNGYKTIRFEKVIYAVTAMVIKLFGSRRLFSYCNGYKIVRFEKVIQ